MDIGSYGFQTRQEVDDRIDEFWIALRERRIKMADRMEYAGIVQHSIRLNEKNAIIDPQPIVLGGRLKHSLPNIRISKEMDEGLISQVNRLRPPTRVCSRPIVSI